jgi:hypothetical protein
MIKIMNILGLAVSVLIYLLLCDCLLAENIDPYNAKNQYAWNENVGWINFEPNSADPNVGMHVSNGKLTGFVWAENIGWINLSPQNYGGVFNNGFGILSGYAWAENAGWINFDPNVPHDSNDYGVKIDSDGNFSGWAWGENIGWINFGLADYYVVTCIVNFEDLSRFIEEWLKAGPDWSADLYSDGNVDFKDYGILADYWLCYCPADWPSK